VTPALIGRIAPLSQAGDGQRRLPRLRGALAVPADVYGRPANGATPEQTRCTPAIAVRLLCPIGGITEGSPGAYRQLVVRFRAHRVNSNMKANGPEKP
jgi:hypothetical protein